ncbi:MAG: carbon-nitrogen hydrolase family protein [Sphaerimonospora mesophila]
MKIALLQLTPTGDAEQNYQKAKVSIEQASASDVDVVLLPELWNTSYSSPEDYGQGQDAWNNAVITQGDDQFQKYVQLATDNEIAVALGYLEKDDDKFYDSVALIDRFGQVILNYRKVHTVRKNWETMLDSGNDFFVVDLNTKGGDVKVGAMICYDREFPEAARILMHKGAEIILVPNSCTMETNRLSQLRARAYENMVGIATANYPSPKDNGRSSAYDGMRKKGEEYDSEIMLADENEGIFYADFDIERLREYRSREIWGDAYRKPWLYGELLDETKSEPFLRDNAETE